MMAHRREAELGPHGANRAALVLAPFFVHLEMLFTFFNCRSWRLSRYIRTRQQTDQADRPELHKAMINAASKRIVAMNKAKRA